MILSNFFGVVLTDDDARAFQKQVRELKPNAYAQRALARGDELLARYVPTWPGPSDGDLPKK